jgi:hypothetical protein
MSDALDDLRKARVAAVSHRRAYALKLAGVWASAGAEQAVDHVIRMQQLIEAIDAAIAYEEKATTPKSGSQELRL